MNAVVERHRISHMTDNIRELESLVKEWTPGGIVPEVDWARQRSLDFQDALRSRDEMAKRQTNKACMLCEEFSQHVSVMWT